MSIVHKYNTVLEYQKKISFITIEICQKFLYCYLLPNMVTTEANLTSLIYIIIVQYINKVYFTSL